MQISNDRTLYTSFKEAIKISKDANSCLFLVPATERVSVQPSYLTERTGIDIKAVSKDKLLPLMLVYSKKYKGIPISYGRLEFGEFGSILESGCTLVTISFQMVVFRPTPGSILKATVNKVLKEGDHVGLLAHNFFNVSCFVSSGEIVAVGEEREVKINRVFINKKSVLIRAKLLKLINSEITDESEVTDELQENNTKRKDQEDDDCEVVSEKKKKKRKIKQEKIDS